MWTAVRRSDTPPTGTDGTGTPWVQDDATPTDGGVGPESQRRGGRPTAAQTVYVYGTGATGDISLSKTSTSTFTASGQTLNYNYVVTNTGTISLTQVSVTDDSMHSRSRSPARFLSGDTWPLGRARPVPART